MEVHIHKNYNSSEPFINITCKVVRVGIRSRIDFPQTESSRSIESWNRGFYQIYSNKIFCIHARNIHLFYRILTRNIERKTYTSMLIVFHIFSWLTYCLAFMYGTYMRGKYVEHLNLKHTKIIQDVFLEYVNSRSLVQLTCTFFDQS